MTHKVTKPIALDESFRTTEQNPQNIADVLANKLDAIKSAIENGGSGEMEAAFECHYNVTSATDIYNAMQEKKVPFFYQNGVVAQLWKVETNKYTFRTTSTRVVEGENILDIVDYIVNGSEWSTATKTISSGSSSQQAYLAKVESSVNFDTTGLSGMQSIISVNDVPADGVYQLSIFMCITPKTASATKSDLVFKFTGTSGTGMPNTTFHAVVDDSQTFGQQLSFSTTLNLKAGTNTLKMECGGLNTEYLVFVDDLTVAQLVNGVYHNGDDFEDVHTLPEIPDFNNDDGVLVDGATGGPRFMLWQTLANKVLGFIKSLSTTITAFRTGDVIPVDGPDGPAKMGKDDLLRATAENAADSGLMPKNETDTNFDFSIVDAQGNAIIIIKDGEVLAQNFDSSLMKTKESKDGQQYFEVCDTNGNCIFAVSTDGTILSKNFDSSKITYVKDDTDGFRIVDYKGNCVLSVNGGNLVSANFDSRMNDYKRSPNYGKSIATFGGSHSVYPESYGMKEYWKALLGMSVTDYGVGGNGYSSLQTPDHNVQKQVDGAGVHDIYLLVCSTNDFTYSRAIGEYNNYSFGDGYDSSKLETMCGGINYAIRKIYEKNPNAKICGFLGLPFFTRYAGYNEFSGDVNSLGKNYFDYISAFAKTMNWNHLPVLDLFHNCGFNVHNKSLFYQNDNLHLTFMGYNRLAMMTTDFISKL